MKSGIYYISGSPNSVDICWRDVLFLSIVTCVVEAASEQRVCIAGYVGFADFFSFISATKMDVMNAKI